ncbi:VIT1/CCC1 transporter family protein [Ktedonobacter sp. SOSP1-85]|uniref:VIT1/CCC1 transporter family protein n=1 Tax=Ktedonobacter sp. SOSP1-85 TaxID=2778367 RepID=UPI0021068812|nr:VIT1/CCC1 transporter family protein [Ktedonobacter sp. SOSP1-85]
MALLIFGYDKSRFTDIRPLRSALQTAVIGGLAAAAAFLIARHFMVSLWAPSSIQWIRRK